jgi:hypothetical protein
VERHDYLYAPTIRAILSTKNLTILDLDLCGILPRRRKGNCHICTSVAALLATLRRLRLRLREICPDALNPPEHDAKIRLNEVLVNLSLSRESPLTRSAIHARRCGPSSRGGSLHLIADMEQQAALLTTQMAAPKMARALTHVPTIPEVEMRAFDILTLKTFRLAADADWDDEGEVIEDKVSSDDEESEISSLSSDADDENQG